MINDGPLLLLRVPLIDEVAIRYELMKLLMMGDGFNRQAKQPQISTIICSVRCM
jgi:hypothetical protein